MPNVSAKRAFEDAWAIALTSDGVFDTLSKFYVTASSERPKVKTSSISVEGMDGEIDTTEITGGIKYENRTVKLWLITKDTAATVDIDNFVNKFVGHVVWLKNVTESYMFKGRLELIKDTQIGFPRKLALRMNAEPFRYAVNETIYSLIPCTATVQWLDFMAMTRQSGTLTKYAHRYDDENVTIFRGNAGTYAVYNISTIQGDSYAIEIESTGADVEVTNSQGVAIDYTNFVADDTYVRIKITNQTNMNCWLKVKVTNIVSFSSSNTGLDVVGFYSCTNPSGTVSIMLNGKTIPLQYTGGYTKSNPDLVIKHGLNNYTAILEDDDITPAQVFIGWRVANV